MEIEHRLQQSTCACSSIVIGTGVQDVDYCLKTNGLVRFRDKIYVPDSSELKKMIFREFHVKSYLVHLGYHKV